MQLLLKALGKKSIAIHFVLRNILYTLLNTTFNQYGNSLCSQEHEPVFFGQAFLFPNTIHRPLILVPKTPRIHKFSQFWPGKSIFQEVLDMRKAKQDLGPFLGVMILTNETSSAVKGRLI